MANAVVTLKSVTTGKSVEISATGPKEATILIPTYQEELDLMDDKSVEDLIAQQVVETATLGQPVILSPLPGATNHDGHVDIEEINLDNFGLEPIVSSIFEISTTRDFTDVVFKKIKQAHKVQNLDRDELNGANLIANKLYFLRVKICINNFSYSWTDTIHFYYTTSNYTQPVIESITINKDVDSDIIETRNKRTGSLTIDFEPYGVDTGAPGDPTNIEVYIRNTDNPDGEFTKLTYAYDPTTMITLDIIPIICFPGKSYHFKIAFYNSAIDIRSPFSNIFTLDIPRAKYHFTNFYIAQNGAFISTTPTVVLENLVMDYNFLDVLYDDFKETLISEEERTRLKRTTRNSKFIYEFNLLKDGNVVHRYNVHRSFEDVVNNAFKGLTFTINNLKLALSTEYELYLVFKWVTPSGDTVDYIDGVPATKTFTTGNIYNIIPNDNLTEVYREYNTFGYYGEILSKDLAPDTTYMGEVKAAFPYKVNDEFSSDGRLFLTLEPFTLFDKTELTSMVANRKCVIITDKNVKEYYKSGLPTGEWLIKQLGIPTKTELSSGIINSREGWIKCYNHANNIIYIAKKPFIADISFDTLEKLYLTSSYGRTIRIGKQLFAVRLLEDRVYSLINRRPIGFKDNVKKEVELYKALHTDLAAYTQGDLGIVSNKGLMHVSQGVIQSITSGYGSAFKDQLGIQSDKIVELEAGADRKYYRPVLELIREGREPWREEPGINYDPFTDTGYYGKITGDDYINGKEIRDRFKLANLHVDTPYPLYYKFYYHGLLVFIPTQPIGNGVSYKELEENNLVHAGKESDQILNLRKYFFTIPNYTENVWLANDQFQDMNALDQKRDFKDSIVRSLLSRVLLNLPFTTDLPRWENDTMPNLDGVIFKDIVLADRFEDGTETENKRVTLRENQLITLGLDTPGFYLPMFFRETVDFDKDLTFPSLEFKKPTIVKEEIEVTKYRMEKKEVLRERVVKKTRLEEKIKRVQTVRKIGTGKYAYRNKERTSTDRYGIMLFHAKKTDLVNIPDPLYRTSMLNITRNKVDNSKITMYFSKMYRSLEEYIVKSCFVTDLRRNCCEPLHIGEFFNSAIVMRDYIQSLISPDIKVVTLRNLVPDRVFTSDDRKHPLGLIYGKVSAELAYYPIPPNYELFNPLYQDVSTRLNLNPTISRMGNNIRNSWTTIEDEQGNRTSIPILNSLLPTESYTAAGNELINQYVNYQNSLLKEGELTLRDFRDNYLFGVVGIDLDTCCYLDDNGIVSGTTLSPRYRLLDKDMRLPRYIGELNAEGELISGKSNGNDFVDIKSERQEYIDVIEEEEVVVMEEVPYFELETYTEIVWEQVPYTETVTVDKIVEK